MLFTEGFQTLCVGRHDMVGGFHFNSHFHMISSSIANKYVNLINETSAIMQEKVKKI